MKHKEPFSSEVHQVIISTQQEARLKRIAATTCYRCSHAKLQCISYIQEGIPYHDSRIKSFNDILYTCPNPIRYNQRRIHDTACLQGDKDMSEFRCSKCKYAHDPIEAERIQYIDPNKKKTVNSEPKIFHTLYQCSHPDRGCMKGEYYRAHYRCKFFEKKE